MFSLIKHFRPLISTSTRPAFFRISYCFMFLMLSIISSDQPVSSLILAFSSSVNPSDFVSDTAELLEFSISFVSVAFREHCSMRANRDVRSMKETSGSSTTGLLLPSISLENSLCSGVSSMTAEKSGFSTGFCIIDSIPIIKKVDLLSPVFQFQRWCCPKQE